MKWVDSAYFIGSLQELNGILAHLALHMARAKEMLFFIILIATLSVPTKFIVTVAPYKSNLLFFIFHPCLNSVSWLSDEISGTIKAIFQHEPKDI